MILFSETRTGVRHTTTQRPPWSTFYQWLVSYTQRTVSEKGSIHPPARSATQLTGLDSHAELIENDPIMGTKGNKFPLWNLGNSQISAAYYYLKNRPRKAAGARISRPHIRIKWRPERWNVEWDQGLARFGIDEKYVYSLSRLDLFSAPELLGHKGSPVTCTSHSGPAGSHRHTIQSVRMFLGIFDTFCLHLRHCRQISRPLHPTLLLPGIFTRLFRFL